jgi:uncharacterized protein involved in response to NO
MHAPCVLVPEEAAMTGSAARRRAWTGPALWSFGFRPFFLAAGLWAGVAMALWIAMYVGWAHPPLRFSPVDWHPHEMLFGYLPAAVAGFLLTAVPNWTGRYPIMGWPLAGLFALWVSGRVAVLAGAALPAAAVAAIDLAFLVVFALAIAREIVAGKNWRNLKVLALIAVLAVANGLYHFEALGGGYAAGGYGARLATSAAILLIVVIGGRIVPSFTRNWLVKQAPGGADPAPFDRLDAIAIVVSLVALALWTLFPAPQATALACLVAGIFNLVRLVRWQGWRAGGEALVWVLHAGFAFVPLGFLLIAAAAAFPDILAPRAALHAFTAGAIGVMTVAVMSRASLGHTGRPLHAGAALTGVYALVIASALLRIVSGVTGAPTWLLHAAAGAWIAGFLGFAALYAPILLRPRRA